MPLPVIPGETVTPGVFNRKWISYLNIAGNRMGINMLPYDGAGNVLLHPVTNKLIKDIRTDPVLAPLIVTIKAKMQELAGQVIEPATITMVALNPMALARIISTFKPNENAQPVVFIIDDMFGLAETNSEFAAVVGGIVAWAAANP